MRVAIPHDLPREEVRRRMKARSPDIAQYVPGGMAEVETTWATEDRMTLSVRAMGQEATGFIDIEDAALVCEIKLPMFLSFLDPIVERAIRSEATEMLEPPKPGRPGS